MIASIFEEALKMDRSDIITLQNCIREMEKQKKLKEENKPASEPFQEPPFAHMASNPLEVFLQYQSQ